MTDLDLAPTFDDEAARIVAALPPSDRLVTSPLHRCRRLAERIGAARALAPVIDERLRELDFGTWEGVPWESIPRTELNAWAADFFHARPHGARACTCCGERVGSAIQRLPAKRRLTRRRDPRWGHQGRTGAERTPGWMDGQRRFRRLYPSGAGLIPIPGPSHAQRAIQVSPQFLPDRESRRGVGGSGKAKTQPELMRNTGSARV